MAVSTEVQASEMTEKQMLDRIRLLGSEMDANDEENRMMQAEIEVLYAKIDGMKEARHETALKKARDLNAEGKRVEAVKMYRVATGASLQAAQAAIDGNQ